MPVREALAGPGAARLARFAEQIRTGVTDAGSRSECHNRHVPVSTRTASELPNPLSEIVAEALRAAGVVPGDLLLGLSGGLDSMVLLDVLAAMRGWQSIELSAMHVNHQLSPHADGWAQLCAERCASYGVPLRVVRVEVHRSAADGLEAAARAARYAVFREQQADAIVLAHHLDDQAETLLLQLLRGAGPRGLAAMPLVRAMMPGRLLRLVRPLLSVPRTELVEYARQHRLRWVDDESNFDTGRDRNYLRHEVLPRIGARFPGYRQAWRRASRNVADLSEVADAQAASDAHGALVATGLKIDRLQALSPARARNLLRWYLAREGLAVPHRDQLEELMRQLLHARAGAQPAIALGGVRLYRHKGLIKIMPAVAPIATGWQLSWHGQPQLELPGSLGTLRFTPVTGAGLSTHSLAGHNLSVRGRVGGERLKPAPNRPTRTLKNLLQEAAMPHWQRDRLPLVFCDDALVWAAEVGSDCRFAAAAEEPGILLAWWPRER